MTTPSNAVYLRQLLSGRDFARHDPVAQQMVNFVYVLGDPASRECLVVDPAYGVGEILDLLSSEDMRCVGVLATHFHPDHIGGDMAGFSIEGITALLDKVDVPIHIQRAEGPWVERTTGVDPSDLVLHDSGDIVSVGGVNVELVHTPGHTPGSQCFLVNREHLVSGDTLFLEGCGRTDLPGGDSDALYESLTTRLARVPDQAVLYPGHLYSPSPSATMGETRRTNYVFRPRGLSEWRAMFG